MKVIGKMDHQKNEVLQVLAENLVSDPAGVELVQGRFWINTTDSKLKYYDGAAVIVLGDATAISITIGLLQTELDDTQAGAGLASDGTYNTPSGSRNLDGTATIAAATLANDVAIAALEDTRVLRAGDTMTGDLTLSSGAQILQPLPPSQGNHLVNRDYADSLAGGFDIKASVHTAITATDLVAVSSYVYDNGTGGVGATLTAPNNDLWNIADSDTETLDPGDRILILREDTNPAYNGIYEVTQVGDGATVPTIFTRVTDMDGDPAGEVSGGNYTFVENGVTLQGNGYTVVWPAGDIDVGTDPINWSLTSSAGAITALQTELDNVETGLGFATDGLSPGHSGTSYIDGQDVMTALETLDGQAIASGKRYLYTAGAPDVTHIITHNLGYKYPAVTVYDQADDFVVEPLDIEAVDDNTTTVTFSVAIQPTIILIG
jgi:hypothetical protein